MSPRVELTVLGKKTYQNDDFEKCMLKIEETQKQDRKMSDAPYNLSKSEMSFYLQEEMKENEFDITKQVSRQLIVNPSQTSTKIEMKLHS